MTHDLERSGEPEELARKNRILGEWCAKVGRDAQEIERCAEIFGPQLDQLDDCLAARITRLIGGSSGPDYDLAWPAVAGDPSRRAGCGRATQASPLQMAAETSMERGPRLQIAARPRQMT